MCPSTIPLCHSAVVYIPIVSQCRCVQSQFVTVPVLCVQSHCFTVSSCTVPLCHSDVVHSLIVSQCRCLKSRCHSICVYNPFISLCCLQSHCVIVTLCIVAFGTVSLCTVSLRHSPIVSQCHCLQSHCHSIYMYNPFISLCRCVQSHCVTVPLCHRAVVDNPIVTAFVCTILLFHCCLQSHCVTVTLCTVSLCHSDVVYSLIVSQ